MSAAFAGLLLVVKPNLDIGAAGVFFALLAAAFLAARVTLHRHYSGKASPMVASFWERGVGLIIMSAVVLFHWSPVPSELTWTVCGLFLSSTLGQFAIVYGISRLPLGTFGALVYWEVAFAVILDVTLLGASIDVITLAGVALIVLSGVCITARRRD